MTELIDENQVKNLKDLFEDGFDDFVLLYFDDFEKGENELFNLIQNNDLDKAKKIAHALKGNSLNVGATALADKCFQLEVDSQKGNLSDAFEHYQELEKMYPSVKQAYLHIVSSL